MKFNVCIVKKNVGEISCSVNKWIYEHKRDLKIADINNSLVG